MTLSYKGPGVRSTNVGEVHSPAILLCAPSAQFSAEFGARPVDTGAHGSHRAARPLGDLFVGKLVVDVQAQCRRLFFWQGVQQSVHLLAELGVETDPLRLFVGG